METRTVCRVLSNYKFIEMYLAQYAESIYKLMELYLAQYVVMAWAYYKAKASLFFLSFFIHASLTVS